MRVSTALQKLEPLMTLNEVELCLTQARPLETIKRFSAIAVHKPESVASHSFFVALGVRLLHSVYKFDLERALCMALVHDLPEVFTHDVGHAVKRNFPKLAAAVKEAETEASKQFPECVQYDLVEYNYDSIARLIVHLADVMEVLHYTKSEIDLGNTALQPIFEYTLERQDDLIAELEDLECKR